MAGSVGSLGAVPTSCRRQGGLGPEPPALGDFCNFSRKRMHFYAYFGQNDDFKAITHQLKAFESNLNVLNRINEVKVL